LTAIGVDFKKRKEDKMPAVSEKQRRMMAIAEHHPSKLYKRNRRVLKMSKSQLHDFAVMPKRKKNSGKFHFHSF